MKKVRLYNEGENELEDRAIKRLFMGAVVAAIYIGARVEGVAALHEQTETAECAICMMAMYGKTIEGFSLTFNVCEPCVDSAMTRLRVANKSRKAAFDV